MGILCPREWTMEGSWRRSRRNKILVSLSISLNHAEMSNPTMPQISFESRMFSGPQCCLTCRLVLKLFIALLSWFCFMTDMWDKKCAKSKNNAQYRNLWFISYILLVKWIVEIVELKRASYSKVKILLCLKELYNPFPMNYQLSVIFPIRKRIEPSMHQMTERTRRKYTLE